MKYAAFLAVLVSVSGCAGVVSMATPDDASTPVKAAAAVADTAIIIRAWELMGAFK